MKCNSNSSPGAQGGARGLGAGTGAGGAGAEGAGSAVMGGASQQRNQLNKFETGISWVFK